jgi:uncharacterized protein (DUF1919 family)
MKKIAIYLSVICSLLLNAICADAQTLNNVQQAFNSYQQNNYVEKFFVHTDRDTYLAGEIIWFKIYLLNANPNHVDFSKVIYVDVLDENNNFILQAKVSFENETGWGSLYIPKTIKSGVFKLRAYTNWLKNFGAATFFEKKLTLINLSAKQTTFTAKPSTYEIQFFPEGGDLVNGINSRVAFKVTGKDGKGIDVSGVIVSEQNDTVAHFNTLKFGMGSFSLKPAANHTYKAISKSLAQEILIKELPKAKSNGYVMAVEKNGSEVTVKLSTNLPSTNAFIFVHNNNQTLVTEQLQFVAGKAEVKISTAKLEEGISSFTIFDSEGLPVCERLFFKRPTKKVELEISSEKNNYSTRKNVNVNLSVKNEKDAVVKGNLSVAVYRLDSLNKISQTDIVSYLWLSSVLKGNIESADYYLLNDNPGANEALDNLLLTQGWRHFKWNEVLTNQKPLLKFLPELNGHLISGTTINPSGGIENKGVYIGVPGKSPQFYATKLNAAGEFLINTKDFYGNKEIVLLPAKEEDSLLKFKVLSPFSEQFAPNDYTFDYTATNFQNALKRRSISVETQHAFISAKLNVFSSPTIDTSAFYSSPYKVYDLDLYTRFPTLKESITEFIAEVRITKHQKSNHLIMIGERDYLKEDPLVLLDGVPYTNIDKVLTFDPAKIKNLAIVRDRYFYGGLTIEGIITLSTINGDLGGQMIDPNAMVVDYEGLELQREFYSPTYETDEKTKSRLPDFRDLLYWSPDLILDSSSKSNISFYTSDQTGDYVVVVQGITQNGIPLSKKFIFSVGN